MDKFEAMRRFALVAQTGSFTQTADRLGLPKSSVSSAVQSLEKTLGTRLLQRSTRSVKLTHDGEAYLGKCLAILDEMEALENLFCQQSSDVRGVLSVDMPNRFATNVVLPYLNEWFELYPQVKLKLSTNDQRVDMIKEGIDCVIRVGSLDDSNLIARPLAQFKIINCIAPAYAAKFGIPRQLNDLSNHQLIDYAQNMQSQQPVFEYLHDNEQQFINVPSCLVVNNTDGYVFACLSGLGIAQIPALSAEPFLKTGELIEILPDYQAAPMSVSLLYPSRRQVPIRVTLFIEWLDQILRRLGIEK